MLAEIIQSILYILGTFLVAVFSYEYIEVGKKRKIETYWKIEGEYKSENQQKARKLVERVREAFKKEEESFTVHYDKKEIDNRLADFYESNFHSSSDEGKKEDAWTIRTRIRFLHLTGVLLKKKMIDKDLLFSLIGLGFQLDHETLAIILTAHRKFHNTPFLYNHFEYLWNEYEKWEKGLSATVAQS